MTGFGRGQEKSKDLEVICEIRSLNHRGLDLKIRMPQHLSAYESEFAQIVRSKIQRGRVDVFLELSGKGAGAPVLTFDKERAKGLIKELKQFASDTGIAKTKISISNIMSMSALFSFETLESSINAPQLGAKALKLALRDLADARANEGKRLERIVEESLRETKKWIQLISTQLEMSASTQFDALASRVSSIIGDAEIDGTRVAQEIAHIVQRADVTEEINRLLVHVEHFRDILKKGGVAGRKLDFLCQEMAREANTASSKILDASVTILVVELKSEIEKMREQVQNIE